MTPPASGPDLPALFALFPGTGSFPEYEMIAAEEVPSPYQELLVHDQHMTLTVEAHHGDRVDVRVLARHLDNNFYARKILLALRRTGKIVQFGIMRVDLGVCSSAVREEIINERTPFGRILIKHNVLRWIEPTAFLRVLPGPALASWFGEENQRRTYGRLAYIHCDGQPAVELLEIVAPES